MTPDEWQTSSYSGENGDCIQIKQSRANHDVKVRDSKDQDGLILDVGRNGFDKFIAELKSGTFGF